MHRVIFFAIVGILPLLAFLGLRLALSFVIGPPVIIPRAVLVLLLGWLMIIGCGNSGGAQKTECDSRTEKMFHNRLLFPAGGVG